MQMKFSGYAACLGMATVMILASGPGSGAQVSLPDQRKPPETLTLTQAIARAASNEPALASVAAEEKAALLERKIARSALLPSATYHNQAIYTQSNGVPASRIGQTTNAPSPIFIANNAVREYASQGVFDEKVGFAQVGAIRLADATAARAQAELEVARRGLVSTVVSLFYASSTQKSRVQIAQQAVDEATHFVELTRKREAAREAAHTDVLKAELEQQQRQRELLDVQAEAAKARIEMAVLLYPDPETEFDLTEDDVTPPLPDQAVVQAMAAKNNPELSSALASVQISQAGTYSARSALLPELALNFTYGIDSTNFGVNGPDGIRNVGYSMSAQLDIPVWDWLATERRVRQAKLRETAARVSLSAAQRRLLASLAEFYAEASVAGRQLASLKVSVDTARESLRLTNLRYVDGESTALEVVDAENALITAENAAVDGSARYRSALANLQTLTGTL